MPNWCSNKLLITGPDIEEFTKTLNEKGEFCFSQTLPVPAELSDIITGSITIDGKHCTAWRCIDGKDIPVTQEEMAAYKLTYGHSDWYEWSIANWGTKWDCDLTTVEVDESAGEESYISCHFDTAWGPPIEWAKNVSKKYPSLAFTIYFSEGGMGFYGYTRIQNGTTFLNDTRKGFYKEVIDDTAEDNLSDECREFLDKHNLHTGG